MLSWVLVVLTAWELLFASVVRSLGYSSDNFIVGLTNIDPAFLAPVLWNYTLCGQYPGTVPDGATVSVQCTNAYVPGLRFQYVIVQFPLFNDTMNLCEIEVYVVGKHIHCFIVMILLCFIAQGSHQTRCPFHAQCSYAYSYCLMLLPFTIILFFLVKYFYLVNISNIQYRICDHSSLSHVAPLVAFRCCCCCVQLFSV